MTSPDHVDQLIGEAISHLDSEYAKLTYSLTRPDSAITVYSLDVITEDGSAATAGIYKTLEEVRAAAMSFVYHSTRWTLLLVIEQEVGGRGSRVVMAWGQEDPGQVTTMHLDDEDQSFMAYTKGVAGREDNQ